MLSNKWYIADVCSWEWRKHGAVVCLGGEQAFAVMNRMTIYVHVRYFEKKILSLACLLVVVVVITLVVAIGKTDGLVVLVLLHGAAQVLFAKRLGFQSVLYVESELYWQFGTDLVLCRSYEVAAKVRASNKQIQESQIQVVGDLLGAVAVIGKKDSNASKPVDQKAQDTPCSREVQSPETERCFIGVLPGSNKLQCLTFCQWSTVIMPRCNSNSSSSSSSLVSLMLTNAMSIISYP